MPTSAQKTAAPVSPTPDPRRWWALIAIATGQLMIAADGTIMNIALPSAQRTLGLSDTGSQWVVTAFALGYGGFLLLGGRVSDLIGRRRALLLGLTGFAAASALGGFAVNPPMLLTARALQGVCGALFTPSALALLGTAFTTPAERGRAFGVYGTIMGSSTGVGVVLGGVFTDYLNWRWSLLLSVPIALAAGLGIARTVRPTPRDQGAARLDVRGAALATTGLIALVHGCTRAQTDGWSGGLTLGSLAAGGALLALFARTQSRTAHALLPPRIVLDRARGGAYLAVLSLAAGNFAAFFFLTFYLQNVLGYSPIEAGLAFLPFTAAIMLGVRVVGRLVMRAPVRLLLCPGLLTTAAGLALLGLLRPDSDYATHVMPVFVLLGLGVGWVLVPANSTATLGAGPDTGVAGATVMTSQQVGASLGTALLGTLATTASTDYAGSHAPAAGLADRAAVHGYHVAGFAGAAFLCVAAMAVFLISGHKKPTP
ncbi:MFS transporter [Streptomyces sp. NPDC059679]|uniref:MFS transporter n=1 Tax=Streptomyces sp. NPDC059679 TaxID=3346903 RepID=UPI00369D5B40